MTQTQNLKMLPKIRNSKTKMVQEKKKKNLTWDETQELNLLQNF